MCGLELSKAENVLGVQQNLFGNWYMSFMLCTLCLMLKLMCLNNCGLGFKFGFRVWFKGLGSEFGLMVRFWVRF